MQTIDLRLRISLAALAAFSLVAALLVAAPSAQADSLSREVHNADDFAQAILDFNDEDDSGAHHVITIMNDFEWNRPPMSYGSNAATLTIQGADAANPPTITLGAAASGFLLVSALGVANVTVRDVNLVGEDGFAANQMLTITGADVWITNVMVTNVHTVSSPVTVWGGLVSVSDSVFSDNSATGPNQGGALLIASESATTISGSTFARNEAGNGSGGALGSQSLGGIELIVVDSVFADNVASGAGGAVWEAYEDVFITRSVFTDNAAGGNGGAVYGPARVSTTDSTFIGNEAAGDGGAIYAAVYFDTYGSTFSGNSSGDDGGALYSGGGSGSVIQHSTFELNTATTRGGAVYTGDSYLAVQMSTLVSNSAPQGAHAYISISTFNMYSSVFADAREGDGCHVSSFANGGYNFDDDGTCTNSLAFGPGLDPLLWPLADNGGYTPTRMPAPGSPLLDRIEAELCALHIDSQFFAATPYDQRGLDILDVLNRGDSGCDIGAVERVGSVSFTLPGLAGDVHFSVDGALAHYGECDDVAPISEGPAGAPAGVALPHGLLSFCVDAGVRGATVTVTVTFPSPVNRAYKVDDAWLELPGATFAGNVLTYELRDGGPLDRALNEAGIIWDPLAAGAAASFTG